jgi:curved DNA-binding protein
MMSAEGPLLHRFEQTPMPVKFRDYYETLGVPRSAGQDDIKHAFRKLARKHHPDVNPGDKAAEDRFKEISEANQVLSDPEKRRYYDELGADWKAGMDFTVSPGGADAFRARNGETSERSWSGDRYGASSDFFEAMFGRRPEGAGFEFHARGPDIESEISIPLEEAHRGTKRVVRIPVEEPCPECGGTGVKEGKTCPVCHGSGTETRFENFTVNIPKGVQDGSAIRVPGKGGAGLGGGARGDLYLRIHIQPDKRFRLRDRSDTELDLPLAPWEAVLGSTIRVPTLDGLVELRIPPGSQAGQTLRLRGKGLAKQEGGQGDQYVRLKIVVPTKPTEKELELLKQLATESSFKPRMSWN